MILWIKSCGIGIQMSTREEVFCTVSVVSSFRQLAFRNFFDNISGYSLERKTQFAIILNYPLKIVFVDPF